MKIVSGYKSANEVKERLKSGDVVLMKGSEGTNDFYGIYCYGIGIIELENGSDAYTKTKEALYLGSKVSYWTVEKVFRNCELIIKE